MEILITKNGVHMQKLVAFFLLSTLTLNVHGYTFTPEVGVDVKQHSNISKDATNTEDTVVAPYFGFNFRESNPVLDTSVDFHVTHEEYLDNSFSSLNLYNVNAFADWSIILDRFVWVFEDVAQTQRISAADTSRPDNLQTINVLSTGPNFIFQENVWLLLGKIRYGDINYSDSGEDGVFISGSFAAQRDINEYSRVSSGVVYRTNDFDDASLSDYDIGKVSIDYARDLPAGKLLTGVGYSYANIDPGKEDGVPYFNLLLSYQPTGSFTVELSAVSEFADDAGRAYDALASRQTNLELGASGLETLATPGVYDLRNVSLTGKYSAGLLSWDISTLYGEKSFDEGGEFDVEEGTGFSTELFGVSANIGWSLSERMDFGVGGSYNETDYPDEGFNDEEYIAEAALNYRFTKKLFTRVGVSREEKKSNVVTREFDDDVVFFSLFYKGGVK